MAADVHRIIEYAASISRNKIVFSNSCFDGLQYIDVGAKMANFFHDTPDICGKETLYKQVMGFSKYDKTIGKYLAIKNIGFLFEPSLHHNLESIVDYYSRDQILIICAEGVVKDHVFYFWEEGSKYKINLRNLSYIFV